MRSLPDGIWNMQRLKNLYLSPSAEPSLPNPSDKQIKPLLNLQVLSGVLFDPKNVSLIKEGKIPNLRKLGIFCGSLRCAEEVLPSLHHLRRLQNLKITSRYLKLPGDPHSFPFSITKITLKSFVRRIWCRYGHAGKPSVSSNTESTRLPL